MELPRRAKGDEYAPPGRVGELIRRIGSRPGLDESPVACFYPFDFRSRLIPFLFYDHRMMPAGVRAVASAFHEAGFKRTRAIFQLWSPNVRPSACRIDGRPLQVMTLTTMQIHSAPSYRLIEDAWSMGPDRPLILAGGPKATYEPDHYFGLGPAGDIHADAVATGEELVLLELLDRITECRGRGESLLRAFQRCRDAGLLDDIPGLVYLGPELDRGGRPVLIDTGIQRLVRDLDELPHPQVGFRLLEPPHGKPALAATPLAPDRVHKYSRAASLVTTRGCKWGCPYCPIPAYNQRTWRHKSPERLVDEFKVLREQFGIRTFFGTDDNFFNHRQTAEELLTALARVRYDIGGVSRKPTEAPVCFATEATESDVLKNRDLIPLAREAGAWAIWFGIEDLAAELINKGQTPEKTIEMFRLLSRNQILPMVMMMYHDRQPARTGGADLRGLINQARFLFKHGAVSYQCTLHTPSPGSREYEATFRKGVAISHVDGRPFPDVCRDGNHVVASSADNPARIHWNMLLSYLTFYNPIHLLKTLLHRPSRDPLAMQRAFFQGVGMISLAITAIKTLPWMARQSSGRLTYWQGPPPRKFTVLPAGGRAGRPDGPRGASDKAQAEALLVGAT